jgi:hypothetical protein
MTTTTHAESIISIFAARAISPRLRSWTMRMRAKSIVSDYLDPMIPADTLGWLVFPAAGESARHYAERAVEAAAARASWAGGLTDGTAAVDAASMVSSAWVARR